MSDREQIITELSERVRQLKVDLDANGLVAPELYSGPELIIPETSKLEIPLFFLGLIGVATLIAWLLLSAFGGPVKYEKEILQPVCYNAGGQVDCNLTQVKSTSGISWEKR